MARQRKFKFEDDPFVKQWCEDLRADTELNQGYTPTDEQLKRAFLAAVKKALATVDDA
jgi:hypothetical protein